MIEHLPTKTDSTVPTSRPWITQCAIFVCVVVFIGTIAENNHESWHTLSKFGYASANEIWNGAYWVLVSSAFVHLSIFHIVFNLYWLWILGQRLELEIGPLPFLIFFIVSAWISSSFQLAASDDTGIGASGVVYAIFGYMWQARNCVPSFREVLDKKTIQLFLIWLIGCYFVTLLGIWTVGNTAHLSGLAFGMLAGASANQIAPVIKNFALTALSSLSVLFLFWCPWSVPWLMEQAYHKHSAKEHEAALELYDQIIESDPTNAWAYLNRSYVLQELGAPEKAQADHLKALQLDPHIE